MWINTLVAIAAAATLACGTPVHAAGDTRHGALHKKQSANWQPAGCYSSVGSMTLNGTSIYQSSGACESVAGNHNTIALTGRNTCYYGDSLPDSSAKLADSECTTPCFGYAENCGGSNYWFWTDDSFVSAASSTVASTSTPTPTTTSTTTVTSPPSTIAVTSLIVATTTNNGVPSVVTVSATAAAATVSVTPSSSPAASSSGSTNIGAVAGGVVAGILAVAAIAVGAFLFLRSKKNKRDAEDSLQRANSLAAFNREKPASTLSLNDSRLEPAYMRRMSNGSIADNQDFSRKILKVTNA